MSPPSNTASGHTCSLNIGAWAAFAPHRTDPSQWRAWAEGRPAATDEVFKPELPQVPAMLRRRLSPLGRAALWALFQLRERSEQPQRPPLATLFCSRHGEVARTVSLLQELAQQQPLSPAAFSLSVHNAVGGIYSIASGETGPISALSAGPDGICAALLEAWCLLQTGTPDDRVLCVIYDDALPLPYEDDGLQVGELQALALEVRKPDSGEGCPLSFSLSASADERTAAGAADQFLQLLLGPQQTLTLAAAGRRWQWYKHPPTRSAS